MDPIRDYIKNKPFVFAVILILLLAIVGTGVYYFSLNNQFVALNKTNTEAGATKDNNCGVLKADGSTEGASPLKVVLRGQISGDFDTTKPVCQWSIDGAKLYDSFPVNGACVFGKDPIITKGEHTVSYTLDGKTCSASQKVVVK